MDTPCPLPNDPLLYGARSFPVGAKGVHLWGSIAPDATQATYTDPSIFAMLWRDCADASGGLWQVTTTVKEYRRNVSDVATLPLPDTAISQVPAGVEPFTRRTVVQVRIQANDGADERLFDMDANQSISVVAQRVCVYWLGPSGMVDLLNFTAAQRESLRRTGMVIDAFLGLSLSRIEQQPGSNESVTLTRHLYVPAGSRGSIAIPPYARQVTIYQEPTLGSSSIMWTQTLGDPNGVSGFMTLAALPWIVGERKTEPEAVLPNASHLWSDVDNQSDRFFTLVWTIRP